MENNISFHPHALTRMQERGATKEEIILTINDGESFPVKFNRSGFRRIFDYNKEWNGRHYAYKQLEVYAVAENKGWLVITVITKYF